MRIYNVELIISGPVTTKHIINFDTEKEIDLGNVFRSDILIKKHLQGFTISTTVYTANQDRAHKVALLFIGKMLDVLSMKTNLQLNVSLNEYRQFANRSIIKAVIEEEEFRYCFDLARQLNLYENKLLRAFSWYRKGLYTEDPFDKFLAFWNSISVVADGYCNDNERTKLGTVNRIYDCFITLWGDLPKWEYINGYDRWINDNNEVRNKIAHGGVTVDIHYIENVLNQLETVQNVAYKFLTQWANRLDRSIVQLA
ncbi:MAG: hypothetical protein IPL92_05245 [Saprospiraceae bacterium]|nr:hypothetical protein [Candidatus Opimibacter iunctus]